MATNSCIDCDNVESASRRESDWRWLCVAFPSYTINHVNPTNHEPYNRCYNINKGYCPMFQPLRKKEK